MFAGEAPPRVFEGVSSGFGVAEGGPRREDTWSLGVCNGCQLMALLGWVPAAADAAEGRLRDAQQPRFIHNRSGRFESRWSMVTVRDSPAIMLKVGACPDSPRQGCGFLTCQPARPHCALTAG